MENGTIVWLKSGGPKMTVSRAATGGVVCFWFQGYEIKTAVFSVASLTTDDPN